MFDLVEVMCRYSNSPRLPDFGRINSERRVPAAVPTVHAIDRRLEPETLARLVADYESGVPTTQLTTLYGLGKGTVLRILDDAGVPRRNQPLTTDQRLEAIRLYQSGQSLAVVGRHFDREHTVIRDVLLKAGIPRRDSHGRAR